MIKPNVLLILVGVCALLLVAMLLISGDRPDVGAPVVASSKLLKEFNGDSIKTISLKKGDVSVKLEKKDKSWILASHKNRPAQSSRVETLLADLKAATVDGVRKGSPSLFALDEKGRAELVLENEAGKTTVFLGKSPDWSRSFVQKDASAAIYEVDKGLDNDVGLRAEKDDRILDPAYFFDLGVTKFTAEDVIDIAVKKGNDVQRVQKVIPGKDDPVQPKQELKPDEKPVWWITEPEGCAADDGNVSSITATLSNLTAKAYADGASDKDMGFEKPSAKVKVRLKDGTEHTLTFGKIEGDDVLVKVSGKTDPYKLYKYVYENLTKDLKKKDEEKKDENNNPNGPATFSPPANLVPGTVPPPLPAPAKKGSSSKTDKPKAFTLPGELKTPPPPPEKIEAEAKSVIPPAVVKQFEKDANKIEKKDTR